MNKLITNWKMSELLTFLKSNPKGFKVYKGEKNLGAESNYIFLNIANLHPLPFDDGGVMRTDITINVYSQDYLSRLQVVNYLNTKLFGSAIFRKDDDFFVATLERGVFLDEEH